MTTFSEYVKKASNKGGVARRFNISRMTLSNWGRSGVPMSRMKEVSDATSIKIADLLMECYMTRFGYQHI